MEPAAAGEMSAEEAEALRAFLGAERELILNGPPAVASNPGARVAPPGCIHCGATASAKFYDAYRLSVCNGCRVTQAARYKVVTRAFCKAELLLTDRQIDCLRSMKVPNPHGKRLSAMRLYLRFQARELAERTWGSAEALEAAREERDRRKAEGAAARAKKRQRTDPPALLPIVAERRRQLEGAALGRDPAGRSAAAEHVERRVALLGREGAGKPHEHRFGDGPGRCVDEEAGIYARACTVCGAEVEYEVI